MMKGVISGLAPEVIVADGLYEFDRSLSGIDDMPEAQIKTHAEEVARQVLSRL